MFMPRVCEKNYFSHILSETRIRESSGAVPPRGSALEVWLGWLFGRAFLDSRTSVQFLDSSFTTCSCTTCRKATPKHEVVLHVVHRHVVVLHVFLKMRGDFKAFPQ